MSPTELPHEEQVSDSTRRAIDALQVLLTRSRTKRSLERDRETTSILKDESSPELLEYVNIVSLFENVGNFELIPDKETPGESEREQILPTNKQLLERFRVLELLGRGGMGAVYKACDLSLDRTVAVKIISPDYDIDGPEAQQFRLEARIAANLNHPNIVAVHYLDSIGDSQYFSMEFVEGNNLQEVIQYTQGEPDRPLDFLSENQWAQGMKFRSRKFVDFAVSVFEQIANAIEFAHKKGVVHCDIKPSNIMLDKKGTPRVMDFGVASRHHSSDEIEKHVNGGTRRYMAPELMSRSQLPDPRSDVYALGVTLYEFLTGKRFDRSDSKGIDETGESIDYTPIRKIQPAAPSSLDMVIHRALAADVNERYQSAEEMAVDLRRVGKGMLPAGSSSSIQDWLCQIRNHPIWTIAVVFVLGLIGASVYFQQAAANAEFDRKTAERATGDARDAKVEAEQSNRATQTWMALDHLSSQPGTREQAWDLLAVLDQSASSRSKLDWRNLAAKFLIDRGTLSPEVIPVVGVQSISMASLSGTDPVVALATEDGCLLTLDLNRREVNFIQRDVDPTWIKFLGSDQLLVIERSGKLVVWQQMNGCWSPAMTRQEDLLKLDDGLLVADLHGSTLVALTNHQKQVVQMDVFDLERPATLLNTNKNDVEFSDVKLVPDSEMTVASCKENSQGIGLVRWNQADSQPAEFQYTPINHLCVWSAQYLLACTENQMIMVFDLEKGERVADAITSQYRSISQLGSNQCVSILDGNRIRPISLPKTSEGKPVLNELSDLKSPFSDLEAVASINTLLSDCGRRLIQFHQNKLAYWDFSQHDGIVEINGSSKIDQLKLSPDGTQLAILGESELAKKVRIWDWRNQSIVEEFEFDKPLTHLEYSPLGDKLAVVDDANQIRFIEIGSGKQAQSTQVSFDVAGLRFNGDGSQLLLFGNNSVQQVSIAHDELKLGWKRSSPNSSSPVVEVVFAGNAEVPWLVRTDDRALWQLDDQGDWKKTSWDRVEAVFPVNESTVGLLVQEGRLLDDPTHYFVRNDQGKWKAISDDVIQKGEHHVFLAPLGKGSNGQTLSQVGSAQSSERTILSIPNYSRYQLETCDLSDNESVLAVATRFGQLFVWDLQRLREKLADVDLDW